MTLPSPASIGSNVNEVRTKDFGTDRGTKGHSPFPSVDNMVSLLVLSSLQPVGRHFAASDPQHDGPYVLGCFVTGQTGVGDRILHYLFGRGSKRLAFHRSSSICVEPCAARLRRLKRGPSSLSSGGSRGEYGHSSQSRNLHRRKAASTSFSIASLSAPDNASSAAFRTQDGSRVSYPNGSSVAGMEASIEADGSVSVSDAVFTGSRPNRCLETKIRRPSGRNPTSSRPDPNDRPSPRCSAPGFDLIDQATRLFRDRRLLGISTCPCCAEASRGLPSVGRVFR